MKHQTFKSYNKICNYCGKSYYANRTNQIYCSLECRTKWYNENNYNVSRFKIFERDNFRCIYCGKSSIEDKSELSLDHIYPRSNKIINKVDNLVTSCNICNSEKSNKILDAEILIRIYNEIKKRNYEYFKLENVDNLELKINKIYN